MREELCEIFEKDGYLVGCIAEFDHVVDKIIQAAPGLVLLDINLPGISGFDICRELKCRVMLPVLVLTSRDQMKDELHSLHLGADEYLTKPCRKERLLARAANLLRRYEGRSQLRPGMDFLLDSQTYTLYIHDQSVVLPQNQGRLLEVFLAHPDKLVTKEILCMALWGTTEYIDENALQVNLSRLRKTMKELAMAQQIETLRGLGYRLITKEKRDET